MTLAFTEMGLPLIITDSLTKMGFTNPTPIQEQAIPLAIQGRDILGSAQTGTGKTGAFAIPMINHLLAQPTATALILTPTRELASQVEEIMVKILGTNSGIKSALLIGGDSMQKQIAQLRARPRVIVGTPGRVNDHLTRGNLMLNKTSFFVLDETDKMLDMGFDIQIEKIAKYLPQSRQTLMFSATMPQKIMKMADRYLKTPERITIGSTTNAHAKIKQEVIYVTTDEKYTKFAQELDARSGSIIVFVKTKRGADKLALKLRKENYSADAIHGDLRQSRRERVIENFRNKKYRILIATDVAARGLDISHIEHVINYDLPQVPEDYIHRIGRTGRNGAEGNALCLISPEDGSKWKAISRMLDPTAKVEGGHARGASRGGGKFGKSRGRREDRGYTRTGDNRPKRRDDNRDNKSADGTRSYGENRSENRSEQPRTERSEQPRTYDRPRRDDNRSENRPARAEGGYQGRNDDGRSARPARAEGGYQGRNNDNRSENRPARAEGGYQGRNDDGRSARPAGDRPAYNSDRPARTDRPARSDRPAYSNDRPRGDRPQYSNDRPQRNNDNRGNENRSHEPRDGNFTPENRGGDNRGNEQRANEARPVRTESRGGYQGRNNNKLKKFG